MKVFKGAVIVIVLTFSSVLWAQSVSKASLNFAASQTAKFGCSIRQQESSGLWDLAVVAKDSSNHIIFNYLYSVRPNIKKSMDDCHAWMKAAREKLDMETRSKQPAGRVPQK